MAKNENITFDFRAFRQAMLDGILDTLILGPNQDDSRRFKRSPADKGRRWIRGREVRELLHISSDELVALRKTGAISFKRRFGVYLYDYPSLVALIPAESERVDGWGSDLENEASEFDHVHPRA